MWFEKLTGFEEHSPAQVRKNMSIDGEVLKSHVNGREFQCGILETPTLAELRERVLASEVPTGRLSVREVISGVQELHTDPSNAGALFQAASQFNLLEMIDPAITPEQGVGKYERDWTQGPACAVAAGAGTIYRNYFAEVGGQIGQSADHQIDCLADMGEALGNSGNRLWEMRNGYALATEQGLAAINERLKSASETEMDALRGLLRIGVQWDTEVTIGDSRHSVSQAYCSALPIGYSEHAPELWAAFANLVLEASYEATFCAAILNMLKNGNNTLYLTHVGGGVFKNKTTWIIDAIQRSLKLYNNYGLDAAIVSHSESNAYNRELIRNN